MNKDILILYAKNKIAISKLEAENELIKEQVKEEIITIRGDSKDPVALQEFPGYTFSLNKAKPKWIYSPDVETKLKELEEKKKEEQATGAATDENKGKEQLMFNSPK